MYQDSKQGLWTAIGELYLDLDAVIWVEKRGDGLEKVEEVTEELNSMCTMVGDTMSSVVWLAGARCCGKKSCDYVRLRSTHSCSR